MAALREEPEDQGRDKQNTGVGEGNAEKPQPPPLELIKEISHPFRAELMRRYNAADKLLSPKMLKEELGFPLSHISYHTGVLVGVKALKLMKQRQVRGAIEHLYRSTVKGDPMIEGLLGPIPDEPLKYVPSR